MFDPLLLDFPDSFETSRLIIRPPRPGDGRRHHEAVAESLDPLRQFPASLPWAMAPPSVESSESYCRSAHANFIARKDLPLLLLDRLSGAVVGGSGLHRFDWTVRRFEVGFWCRSSRQRTGLEGVMRNARADPDGQLRNTRIYARVC